MQTILGSGGAIGVELARSLPKQYTRDIRLVSRNPRKVNEADQLYAADLLDQEAVTNAVRGSEVVYVTIGFPYKLKVWKQCWPVFMGNVLEACETHNCKLVFFDNVYMYDPDQVQNMTEETEVNPGSEKGKVRSKIAKMVLDSIAEERVEAMIVRSADFYGPNIGNTSILNEMVIKPLREGKKANWMSSVDFPHSFTYTPDAGKATALLGNSAEAYGQVWHLPTAGDPPTGKQWIEMVARELGVEPRVQVAPKWLMRILGLFNPVLREMPEMMYQYDRDYIFRSDKFESQFDMKPTSPQAAVSEIIGGW